MQRNGRALIAAPSHATVPSDPAHYAMLIASHGAQEDSDSSGPRESLLEKLSATCAAHQRADLDYHLHWIQHLVARLRV